MASILRYQVAFGLRVVAPQHKDHGLRALGHLADNGVGQAFPAFFGVAGGLAFFYRQAGVEQQNALLGPLHQAATWVGEGRERRAQVTLDLFENIAQ